MNNVFQFDRVAKLIGRYIQLDPKTMLQTVVVFAGFPLLFFLINAADIIHIDYSKRTQMLELLVGAAFILAPFAYFSNYNHPKKGLTDAMLPASILEKFVVMQLVCVIFAPVVAFLLYGGVDSLLAAIFPSAFSGFAVEGFFRSLSTKWEALITLFLTLQFVFFCNLFFVRRKALKTIGLFLLVWIAFAILFALTMWILETSNVFANTEGITFNLNERAFFKIYADDHPLIIVIQLLRILFSIVPLGLMIGSYFLMKNKRY